MRRGKDRYTRDRFADAVRLLALEHPFGPICASRGVGDSRWRSLGGTALYTGYENLIVAARREGATPKQWLVETLGHRDCVIRGRVRITEREEMLWIVAEALDDGFVFGPGWVLRADAFGADKPYAFSGGNVKQWMRRWKVASGDALFAEAELLRRRRPGASLGQ
jgi:hypothetical protein